MEGAKVLIIEFLNCDMRYFQKAAVLIRCRQIFIFASPNSYRAQYYVFERRMYFCCNLCL